MCTESECGSGDNHGKCDKTADDYINDASTAGFICMVR